MLFNCTNAKCCKDKRILTEQYNILGNHKSNTFRNIRKLKSLQENYRIKKELPRTVVHS